MLDGIFGSFISVFGVFVLTLNADVLLRAGVDRGRALLDEARQTIAQCPDPGITRPLLDRVAVKHRVAAPSPVRPAELVEQLCKHAIDDAAVDFVRFTVWLLRKGGTHPEPAHAPTQLPHAGGEALV